MKIAYIYPQFARLAGTERVLIDKMNYLADNAGVEVLMVTYEQGSHPMAYPLSSKVKHIDLDVRFYTLYRHNIIIKLYKRYMYGKLLQRRFNRLMADVRPDIVVATTFHGNIMNMIASCPYKFAKVLESHIDKRFVHNNDPVNLNKWATRLRSIYDMYVLNRVSCNFDVVVALNDRDADDWSTKLRTIVIPNIVHLNDTGRYSKHDSKRVIFVGRYNFQKGIPDLFSVWKLVYKLHPDWCLDLYGDGDLRDIPYSESDCLAFNINVHKPDSNIIERYIESSIFVLTSLYEPFGLVMPEAMSCGLPVVAFDCPSGPANIITDGVDGFLVKDRNLSLFVDRMCQLIDSYDLRVSMGKAAICSSQRYSATNIMGQWLDLFNELLSVA